MPKVAFLGGGSFGSALSIMLAKAGMEVNIWDRKLSVINDINIKRENIKYYVFIGFISIIMYKIVDSPFRLLSTIGELVKILSMRYYNM